MQNGCKQLVEVCADLKANESALIVTDTKTQEIGNMLSEIAKQVSPHIRHETIAPAEMHGKEPPAEVAEKMQQADVIFGLTSMSMTHTSARHQATSKGSRYLSLPDYTFDLLKRAALFVDFREITGFSHYLAQYFTKAKKVRITTNLGTDLTLNITDRIGNAAPGWCFEKGSLASPPDAEVNVAPVEEESEGVLVVDGSIPCRELGLLSMPLALTLRKGKVVDIQGNQAAILNTVFNKHNTDATRVAAEFGIGLNPAAELIGSMLEDEGCLGTIHIGFGSNITIGGRNKVPFHLDTIVRNASIYLDDKLIMEEGSLERMKATFESECLS